MFAEFYRVLIPVRIREKIYHAFLGKWLALFRYYLAEPLKAKYYVIRFSLFNPRNESERALKEWGIVGPCPWPYLWVKEYRKRNLFSIIQANTIADDTFAIPKGSQAVDYDYNVYYKNDMPYVNHRGKKLFFQRGMTKSQILDNYIGLLIEQDKRSAHCYITDYAELQGRTLLDIGSAEGIFTLDTVEYIQHAYLFESDNSWIEALEATFEPYRGKVTIVKKYVSDVDDIQNITLDTFFIDKHVDSLFLKMDIEGYERKALAGATRLLVEAADISGAVCVYHKKDDPEVIGHQLVEAGLTIEQTPGYLYMSRELRPGVLRFRRKN